MIQQNGFTVLELMITVAVIVALMAMGVPALQQYATNNRVVAQSNRISGDLSLARSEAIRRGQPVTLCTSNNSTESVPTCSGAEEWESGWIAFVDANDDTTFASADGDVLVSVAEALPGGLTLRSVNLDDNANGKLQFRSNGSLDDGDADGSFVVCDADGNEKKARAINIGNLGRTSVATDTDGNDIVNITGGDASCP